MKGVIIKLWDEGNAYRIRLKGTSGGLELWAGEDIDNIVRKKKKYSNNKKKIWNRGR